jgi:hypothetical protein
LRQENRALQRIPIECLVKSQNVLLVEVILLKETLQEVQAMHEIREIAAAHSTKIPADSAVRMEAPSLSIPAVVAEAEKHAVFRWGEHDEIIATPSAALLEKYRAMLVSRHEEAAAYLRDRQRSEVISAPRSQPELSEAAETKPTRAGRAPKQRLAGLTARAGVRNRFLGQNSPPIFKT